MSTEPMLRLYNADRELLFYGNVEAAQARGIRIKRNDGRLSGGSVVLDGRRYGIINHSLEAGGHVGLWLAV